MVDMFAILQLDTLRHGVGRIISDSINKQPSAYGVSVAHSCLLNSSLDAESLSILSLDVSDNLVSDFLFCWINILPEGMSIDLDRHLHAREVLEPCHVDQGLCCSSDSQVGSCKETEGRCSVCPGQKR